MKQILTILAVLLFLSCATQAQNNVTVPKTWYMKSQGIYTFEKGQYSCTCVNRNVFPYFNEADNAYISTSPDWKYYARRGHDRPATDSVKATILLEILEGYGPDIWETVDALYPGRITREQFDRLLSKLKF